MVLSCLRPSEISAHVPDDFYNYRGLQRSDGKVAGSVWTL
jgi:hypothetical protein